MSSFEKTHILFLTLTLSVVHNKNQWCPLLKRHNDSDTGLVEKRPGISVRGIHLETNEGRVVSQVTKKDVTCPKSKSGGGETVKTP